jgi:hypothetical protein
LDAGRDRLSRSSAAASAWSAAEMSRNDSLANQAAVTSPSGSPGAQAEEGALFALVADAFDAAE